LIESRQRQKRMDIALIRKISEVLGLPIETIVECELRELSENQIA